VGREPYEDAAAPASLVNEGLRWKAVGGREGPAAGAEEERAARRRRKRV